MTTQGKTFKEQKDTKEKHDAWRASREGKPEQRKKGGHTNLLRDALEAEEQEPSNEA